MIRLRPPGILPLELWDLRMPEGGILWDHMRAADFGSLLRAAISEVWHGTAVTRSDGPVLLEPHSFEVVHLTGGGALNVAADMRHGPWAETTVARETAFSAASGGEALLRQRRLQGWVLDVGQTALKLSAGPVRLQRQRDWRRLPLRDDALNRDEAAQRSELRLFLASLLQEMHQLTHVWPEGIVAALPSRLDDDGVPEGSSYVGMKGDLALLPDAMKAAGMPDMALFVLNDAELAAVSKQHESDLVRPALVLTLGFGVGGALILP